MNYEESLDYFYKLKENATPFFSIENYDIFIALVLINIIMISILNLMISAIIYDNQQIKYYGKDEKPLSEKEKNIFISTAIFIGLAINILILSSFIAIKNEKTEYEYTEILESPYYQQLSVNFQKIVDDSILADINENKLNNNFKTTIPLFKLEKILRAIDNERDIIELKEQEQETLNKLKSSR